MSKNNNRKAWDYPICPDCKTNVLVAGVSDIKGGYKCHACGKRFDQTRPYEKGVDKDKATKPATESELKKLYGEFDTFMVPKRMNVDNTKQHLKNNKSRFKTLCDEVSGYRGGEMREVGKSIYPRGYNDICKNCLKEWRNRA